MKIADVVPIGEVTRSTRAHEIEEHFEDLGPYCIEAGPLMCDHPLYHENPKPERLAGASILAGIIVGWELRKAVERASRSS